MSPLTTRAPLVTMRAGVIMAYEKARTQGSGWQIWLPLGGAMLAAGAVVIGHGLGGDTDRDALLAARYTARASFALFLIVYLAGPLVTLKPGEVTRGIARDRRWWGLAFAAAHFIHLAALIRFFVVSGEEPKLLTVVGGGFGYVVLAAMAATSTDRAQRVLGSWWNRLHTFGLHYLWFVFAFSYFGRLFDPARQEQGIAGFGLAIAALILRIVAARRRLGDKTGSRR